MTVIILKSVIVTSVTLKCICSAGSFMCVSIVIYGGFLIRSFPVVHYITFILTS
jgi:hypothetical protein